MVDSGTSRSVLTSDEFLVDAEDVGAKLTGIHKSIAKTVKKGKLEAKLGQLYPVVFRNSITEPVSSM